MGGACSVHRELRNTNKIFLRKLEGKRPFGRPVHRQDDIKVDLRKIDWTLWVGFM
jgi:hypothetical protein